MVSLDSQVQPIWEVSPFPIIVIGYNPDPQDRNIVYVNSAFSELNGYSQSEAVGQPPSLLHGPKTEQIHINECEAALRKGKPYEYVTIHYRKDGTEYFSRVTMAPLLEPDGSAEYLITLHVKISSDEFSKMTGLAADASVLVPLTLPMPLQEYPTGELPRHLPSHPELDALQDLWTKMCRDRPMPPRSDFSLEVAQRWAANLSIATVTPDGRFQFRLFGTKLIRVYGRDLTGAFLDELTPVDLWSVITLHYRAVVNTRKPLYAPVSISNGRWYTEVSRLLLPLSDDGDRVNFVMGADYTRSKI